MKRTILMMWCVLTALAWAAPAHAAFPGKNGRIAFTHFAGGQSDIWSIDPDGTDPVNLTNTPNASESTPAWSSDGRLIAFHRAIDGFTDGIHYMRADGTDVRRATSPFAYTETDIDWSPGGDRIALSANGALYTVKVPCPGLTGPSHTCSFEDVNVLKAPGLYVSYSPAWSPHGDRIAFVASGHDLYYDIHTIGTDGSSEHTVLQTDDRNESNPDWSPDGSRISFGYEGSLFVTAPDGTALAHVSDRAAGAAWSPDSTRFATEYYQAGPESGADISVIDADGSNRTVFPLAGHDEEPDWQPLANRPPDCTGVEASPAVLDRAVRNRFIRVRLSGAADPDGDQVSTDIDGVTQDEPVTGPGDPTRPDARQVRADTVQLRSERAPRGDGRVYRISFTATDASGGSCTGIAKVSVPRHKKKAAVDSAPPSFDSLER